MAEVILESKKIKSVTVSIVSPSICREVMGLDAMTLFFECWVLSLLFHSPLSPSSRSSLVPLHFLLLWVVTFACQRLLTFLPAIFIPSWTSSNSACHMMYSTYKLNKEGDNKQPWHSFPSFEPVHCSMSGSNCFLLTCVYISQKAGKVVWYSHFFKNFP